MPRSGTADLPLHGGRVPAWLAERMTLLGSAIVESVIYHYGRSSLLSLTFGTFFIDYDLDGMPDIFAANGHIEEEIGQVQPKVSYREAPLLFRNLGNHKFENVTTQAGPALSRPIVARGAAYADFDRDGDLDILIAQNHGPAVLLRNDGGNRNHWLNVRLAGTKANRDGIGAVVRVGKQ